METEATMETGEQAQDDYLDLTQNQESLLPIFSQTDTDFVLGLF